MLHRIRFTKNILVTGDTPQERLECLLRILSNEGVEPYAIVEEAPEYSAKTDFIDVVEMVANGTIRKIL